MTEREKMISGALYDPSEAALLAARNAAKEQCVQYNSLPPSAADQRDALLRGLLGSCGTHVLIEPSFFCDYGFHIHVGEHFYANHNLVILDAAPVVFGEHVFIAPNCAFYTAAHPFDVAQRNAELEYAKPIRVGSNVWIGGNVCVLPGVTVGDNTVIGAGSVVNRDIPAGVLAVGNPCRPVRSLQERGE